MTINKSLMRNNQ